MGEKIAGKTHSREHKKVVKNDIRKRAKKIAKKKRADIADISRGSRVVQRTGADVRRAPAYRAERIKTGGYHSTFPSGQGILDGQMQMQNMIQRGLKSQKNQNEFKMLIDQGMGGNIDLDQVSNELKQQISQQIANVENEKRKNKLLKEYQKVSDEANKVRNEGLSIAKAYDKSLISRSNKGTEKLITKKALEKRLNAKNAELKSVQDKFSQVRNFRENTELHENLKKQLDFEKKRAKELLDSEKDIDAMKAIDNEDMVQLRVIRERYIRDNETFKERMEKFREHGNVLEKYLGDKRQMELIRDEIDLMGDKTGRLTQKLSRLEKLYGHDQTLLNEKIKEESEKLVKQGKKLRDIITDLRIYEDNVKDFGQDYFQKKAEIMRRAQNVIAMDPYVDENIKDLADRKVMKMNEINEALTVMQRRRYDAHKAYAKVLNEIDSKILYHDAKMAEWDRPFRVELRKLIAPVVEHYQNLGEDFRDDVIKKEKRRVSQETWMKMKEITGKTPQELVQERGDVPPEEDHDYVE